MKLLKKLFRGKTQGKHFVEKWEKNESQAPEPARVATLAGVGAGGGALVGLATGGIAAKMAINKVPYEEVTVSHFESVKQSELMGYIPPDDYEPGSWRPSDDGVPTEPVYRNNPVYSRDGEPKLASTSTTFRGRGEPQPLEWNTEEIRHHNMNESNPYDYSTREDRERYLSHYETVHKTRQVPYSDTETYQDCSTSYNANGSSSYDCDTKTRSVTRYRSESYTEQEPVYKYRTVGYWQNYSENIQYRVVGTVEKPNIDFDHGVDVSSYLVKGLLYGAAIGAVAGGVTAAMEERFFPGVLPGYKEPTNKGPSNPRPGDPGPIDPKPPVDPGPVDPSPPDKAHSCGGRQRHTHDDADFRHTHSSADRWHYHGCPDEGTFDEDTICFKETQVPDCYEDDTPLSSCDSNDSVCYIAHD